MKIYDLPVMQGREKSFYMRHINSFLSFFGIDGGGKAWWNGLPVERPHRTGENPVYIYDAAGKIIGHKIGNGKAV